MNDSLLDDEGQDSGESDGLRNHQFASFAEAAGSAVGLEEAKSNDEMLRVVDWGLMKIVQMEQMLFSLHDYHEDHLRKNVVPDDEQSTGEAGPVVDAQKTAAEAGDPDGLKVQKKYIKVYLEKEITEADACMTLPFVILMLAAFCAATIGDFGHYRTETFHAQDNAMVHDIYENANFAFAGNLPFENGRMGFKNAKDVNSVADFWSWLNSGLVPLFFPGDDSWATSEVRSTVGAMCGSFKSSLDGAAWPVDNLRDTEAVANVHGSLLASGQTTCPESAPPPHQPTDVYGEEPEAAYLAYNEIVGGMRMRQEYTPDEPCISQVERFRSKLFKGKCLEFGKNELEPELARLLVEEDEELVNTPSAPDVFLKAGWTYKEHRNVTRQLENQVWFSPHTQRIELLFTTYNPATRTFTATFIFFVMNRAGHIFKVIEPVTFYIHGYPHGGYYVGDIIWCLCILKIFVSEVYEIYSHIRALGVRKGWVAYIDDPRIFIDWLNVSYAFVILGMWVQALSEVGTLKAILQDADAVVPGNFLSDARLADFFDQVVIIVRHQYYMRRLASFYPFVIVSGFMKPFSQQPRLGVMTETLVKASVDIFHFGVVFMLVFLIYSIMAMLLFGQESAEFANFGRAFAATFQCLLGTFVGQERMEDGEFPLARVGRFVAALWLWSLCWMVNLTMLNMLLAIVMDTYSSVKGGIDEDAETLWSQALEIVWRTYARFKGDWALSKILRCLDPEFLDGKLDDEDDKEEITVDKMLSMIEGLPIRQARDVLEKANKFQENDKPGPQTTFETARTVSIMEVEVNELTELAKANNLLLCCRTHPFDENSDSETDEVEVMPSYCS